MDENINKAIDYEQLVENTFQQLIKDYLSTKHRKRVEIITRAFRFAQQAHKGVKRRSGEPYIMHPLSVASIVCNEIGLGSTSICASLLHDVVEDTDYTVEDLSNIFGPKIADIVDGLTKISSSYFTDANSIQVENYKKLLLTMSNDIRVIFVKIADRLHNMRTLGSMLPSKQYKIAGETTYIYAPLANRLGLNRIKIELENLSFMYEHADAYATIKQQLENTSSIRDELFQEFTSPIRKVLDKMGFKYTIKARVKSIYSIWHKMQVKEIPFEDVFDILAVRIIFDPKDLDDELTECYSIYVALTKLYIAHPDRTRDWLNNPKENGYQALHVTLMSKGAHRGEWVEVQIRSERMNAIAEQGLAAHWKYKEGNGGEDEVELNKWLHTIKEILADPQPDAMDFLDTIKLNLFSSEIYVFTPKGEIKNMPQSSTVLDFAFSLHTDIGTHYIGAKVNRVLVGEDYQLKSGDQVEILTSKSKRVKKEWESMVTTVRAKTKIQNVLRKQSKIDQTDGEKKLLQFFKDEELPIDSVSLFDKLCHLHDLKKHEDLYEEIGNGNIVLGETERILLKGNTSAWRRFFRIGNINVIPKPKGLINNSDNLISVSDEIDTKKVLNINAKGLNTVYQIAECCKPIPGDNILGYIDKNNHVTIHKRQCGVAVKLKSSYGHRIIAAQWSPDASLLFKAVVSIRGIDRLGLLNEVTKILSSELHVNMKEIHISSDNGIFEGRVQLLVHEVKEVQQIISELQKIKGIKKVARIENLS